MLRLRVVELVRTFLQEAAYALVLLATGSAEVHVARLALILAVQIVDALLVLRLVHELCEGAALNTFILLTLALGHQLIA